MVNAINFYMIFCGICVALGICAVMISCEDKDKGKLTWILFCLFWIVQAGMWSLNTKIQMERLEKCQSQIENTESSGS